MIDERFVFLAICFNFIGAFGYLKDTISGKVKPNKVTWFLWALFSLTAFVAEINQGVGLSSVMTFVVGFNPLVIFFASFLNKKSQWKITKFDLICGAISLLGLLLWVVTKEGNLAILFAILADALAGVPTLIKSYKEPETESSGVYLFAAISAAITLLTLKEWNFATFVFPLYIVLICVTFFALIKFKLGKRLSK
jgi:hypothetical protein